MIKNLYRNDKINTKIVWICFILYIFLFLSVVWFKFGVPKYIISGPNANAFLQGKIPIEETYGFIFSNSSLNYRFMYQFREQGIKRFFLVNFFPNILVTLSIGICLPLLFNKDNLLRDSLIGFSISFIVEIVQLFSRLGEFEFVDLFCNTLGVLLGAIFTKIMRKKLKDTTFNKTVNITAVIITLIELPVDIYLLVNIILNWNYYLLRLGIM